ncbi:hypothetical protein J4438_01890 [Candidatus Woesearchaeota archaeon]|nr:hypothetical protein [Candidatus Woesearchaeota archaeon]
MLIKRNKKAQVAVLDLFIAAMIFGILVTAIMITWNDYNEKIDKRISQNTNLIRAYHISDLLTRYAGKPSAWEKFGEDTAEDPLTIIGLAKEDHVIDNDKLTTFLSLDYNYTKDKLSINSYEYYFKILNIDGSDFNPVIEKGIKMNNTNYVTLKRYVIYNESEAILEFWLSSQE